MRVLRPFAVLLLAVLVSGCFQTKTLVKLNADGSGTVEETVLMNSTMAMAVMMGQEGLFSFEQNDDEPEGEMPDGPYTIEALEARAASIGARFLGVTPVEILFGGGYTAVYAFDDINTLALTTDPSALMPTNLASEMGMGTQPMEFDDDGNVIEVDDDQEAASDPVTFTFERGHLTVRMPQAEAQPLAPGADPKKKPETSDMDAMDEGPSPRDMMQMGSLLRDMRFTLAIELPGEVTETTAHHVSGRTLTMYDMKFGEVFSSPEALALIEEMDSGGPDLSAGSMARMGQIPGILYEDNEVVTVSFR